MSTYFEPNRKRLLLWVGPVRSGYSELDPPSSANAVSAGTNARADLRPMYQSFLNLVLKEPMDTTSVRFGVGRR